MNLLIVNDEVVAARGLMAGIDWPDYGIAMVDVAFEAVSAKKKLSEEHFDILLCDIEMPGESGIELVRWVREQKLEIEVIFLTCHADFEFAQEAIRLNCKNYILVPAAYDEVAENIHEVVMDIRRKKEAQKQQQYGQLWLAEKEGEKALEKAARSPEAAVQNAETYIRRHLNDPELSLREIASCMYLNADYLNRIFKRIKGVSIGRYMTEQRMVMAADMLKDGMFNATEISQFVGYNSYPSFVAAFKNYYGCSPSKYLESEGTL